MSDLTNVEVQGINLKIDDSITILCQESNRSSASTRTVLYILLLTSVVSLIAVLGSFSIAAWPFDRFKKLKGELFVIDSTVKKLKVDSSENKEQIDSLLLERDLLMPKIESSIRSIQENNLNVMIPFIYSKFDINDLGIVSGLSFILLLIFFRFTQEREKNNLIMALISITERYTSGSDKYLLRKEIEFLLNQNSLEKTDLTRNNVISKINFTRRKYHYNFLTMNEVYTLPNLSFDRSYFKQGTLNKYIIINKVWFSFLVYLFIIINDVLSYKVGWDIDKKHTIILHGLELIFFLILIGLSLSCSKGQKKIQNLYDDFFNNEFKMKRF